MEPAKRLHDSWEVCSNKSRPVSCSARRPAQSVYHFIWDGDNRLRGIKEGTTSRLTARYNGAGERVVATEGWTGTHTYSRTVGAYYDTFNNALTTPGLGQKVNNVDKYFHTDAQGSTRGLSDSTGTVPNALRYDAFGVQTWQSGGDWHPSSALYAGAWGYEAPYSSATEPGLGFLYVEQRYYDPDTGRFISPDPIGFGGGLNLYAYCENDPINFTDPSGLNPWLIVAGGLGGVRGALDASDAYVGSHGENYSWSGHISANIRGAALGVANTFNPVAIARGLQISAQRLGGEVGCYESGHGSLAGVAWAGADTTLQVVGTATMLAGVGRAVTAARPAFASNTWTRVGRWMTQAEYEAMVATGTVQTTREGLQLKSVITPPDPGSFTNVRPGSVHVEFDVPSHQLAQGG